MLSSEDPHNDHRYTCMTQPLKEYTMQMHKISHTYILRILVIDWRQKPIRFQTFMISLIVPVVLLTLNPTRRNKDVVSPFLNTVPRIPADTTSKSKLCRIPLSQHSPMHSCRSLHQEGNQSLHTLVQCPFRSAPTRVGLCKIRSFRFIVGESTELLESWGKIEHRHSECNWSQLFAPVTFCADDLVIPISFVIESTVQICTREEDEQLHCECILLQLCAFVTSCALRLDVCIHFCTDNNRLDAVLKKDQANVQSTSQQIQKLFVLLISAHT